MLASIVLNVMNEEKNIADLLDSLVVQEGPIEIIVVDAASKDHTRDIIKRYTEKYPFVKLYVKPGRRGESTNYGVSLAKGEIDHVHRGHVHRQPVLGEGDARIGQGRGQRRRGKDHQHRIPALGVPRPGRTVPQGERHLLPSCNEAFSREAITKAGGFDSWFITAEDIDLNMRAVDAGFNIVYTTDAVIYHGPRRRSTGSSGRHSGTGREGNS